LCALGAQDRGTAEGKIQGVVEQHLAGIETEPWEIMYFKLFKRQLPVLERALETAALMLGTTSREDIAWK